MYCIKHILSLFLNYINFIQSEVLLLWKNSSNKSNLYQPDVEKNKQNITTEEATKTSIIMPFFQMLGYDIFNPEEFIPEFTADVGIKKGEKGRLRYYE